MLLLLDATSGPEDIGSPAVFPLASRDGVVLVSQYGGLC